MDQHKLNDDVFQELFGDDSDEPKKTSEETQNIPINISKKDITPELVHDHGIKIEYSPDQEHTPEDIHKEYLKSVKKRVNGGFLSWLKNGFKTIAFFIIVFTISFIVLNLPAVYLKTKYFFQVEQGGQSWALTPEMVQMLSKDNNLYIPKIGVDVPVFWNISDENTLPTLEKGVAHYLDTALPGDAGNVFISGHSSYYWWNEGSFKEIFALLDKTEPGDKIYISYKGQLYTYQITDKKVVKPSDMSVLAQSDSHTLSLMTCVPVGTNLNRLIVTAVQL